jgi:ferric-dicitrate binding protein FerR (iron transport regulator)
MTQKIENIIVKYITKSASSEDLDILLKWIEKSENQEVFKEYVKTHYVITSNMNKKSYQESLDYLLLNIRKEKTIRFKLTHQPIFKYAIAASLVLITTLVSLYNKSLIFNDVIVAENIIKEGIDKATLTLEDGTNIILDKETEYHSDKLSTNGKALVYNKDEKVIEKKYNYLTIPRGGKFFVELSDGTKVWINSDSKLKYPVSFIKGDLREVELIYGEAYFEVAKSTQNNGDAFSLKINEQYISVLGTVFNVKAYRDETEILTTLVEGSVLLSNGLNKKLLKPGQQSKLSQNKSDFEIYKVDVEDQISWINGVFSFTEKPLEEIMKVLSRWYDVDILIDNEEMKSINFTGVISKQQSINSTLEIIKSTNNMTYEIDNKTIVIK